MKILIISQYFWPENFRINDLALGLQERGNEVHVLTGKPNYPNGRFFEGYSFFKKGAERYKGIKIFRSTLLPRGSGSAFRLILNYFTFALFASIKALFLRGKYDLVFVYEPSPISVGIPAVVIAKRLNIPIYFWVQDLWPESVSAAGQLDNKFVLKSLDNLTKWIYKNSNKLLIQSESFRQFILKQGVENNKIIYYPNSTEALYDIVEPSAEILEIMPKVPFSIVFAGNIGESQDFETIIEAAKLILKVNQDIHFVVLGDGRNKQFVDDKIKEFGLEGTFHLLGSFPVEKMPYFFANADALLVTLKKEGEELFHWFMSQSGEINGFTKAIWSGITTLELAKAIFWAIENDLNGLYHLTNNDAINKYELLKLFKKYTNKNILINKVEGKKVNKSFKDTRKLINYEFPNYEIMVSEMVSLINNNKNLYSHYFN